MKKTIKKHYHKKELNKLKDILEFSDESSVFMNKKTPLFIPSIISFVSAFVLVVVSLVISFTKNLMPESDFPIKTTNNSLAISHLEENTNIYLKDPIQTIYDTSSNTIVKVYYGISSSDYGYNHYFLIEYQSENNFNYQASVYAHPSFNIDGKVEDTDFNFENINEENVIEHNNLVINEDLTIRDYQTTAPNVFIKIKIEDGLYIIFIDLQKHFYDLIYLSFN